MTTVEPDPAAAPAVGRLAELEPRVHRLEERVRRLEQGEPSAEEVGRLALDVLGALSHLDDLAEDLPPADNGSGPLTGYRERLDALVAPLAERGAGPLAATTPTRQRAGERRAARAALLRSIAGQALSLVGVLIALFLTFQFVVTDLSASRAQASLTEAFRRDLLAAGTLALGPDASQSSREGFEDVEGIGAGVDTQEFDADAMKERLTTPEPGQPIAILSIPSIDLRQIVVEGSGSTQLAKGPGHYRGSPRPGYIGNSVVAGHRTTYGAPFRHIDRLEKGDRITVTTVDGQFVYEVRDIVTIKPGQDDVTGPKFENLLTLVTSTPAYRTENRLAVVAELQDTPVVADDEALARRNPAIAADELGVFRDATAWAPAVIYFQLLAGTWILAKLLTARWRRWSTWLITAPLLFTFGFLFLESAARLLPSTY
ncbi:MAG TPA: class E sortase [Acidimicrobiales bacterium]